MSTVRIQIRRGLAADWTSVDPDLAPGELGLETDTGKMKVGAETATAWTSLPYINVTESGLGDSLDDYILAADRGAANGVASLDSTGNVPFSQLGNIIDGAPGVLDTLNEIAAAVNDDATFFTTVSNSIATKLALAGGTMSGAIAMGNNKITGLATPTTNFDASTKKYVDDLQQQTVAGIFTHEGTTTNIHGVADMTALATFSYVDTAVSTHAQDTTNIHGIADTADLATIDYVDSEISTLDTAAQGYATTAGNTAATNLSNHSSDTTNVHGISDTAALALTADVNSGLALKQDKVTGVSDTEIGYLDGVTSAIQTQINSKASSSDLSSHASDTTSIHGISDTANLAYVNAANQTFTGNMEVDGNLVVDGDFTVNGTNFSASATSITIEDNMVQLAHQNAANTVDLGIVVAYNDGAAKHAGIVRDVSDAKWKLFKGVSTEPSTTVAFGEGSLDDLALNNITAAGVVFTDGTQTKEGVVSRTPIVQKTASYTLSALTERDNLIEISSSSGVTLTIPTDATLNFPVGTSLDILQTSTGQVTIAGESGTTVNATPGLKLRTQWSSATLFKRAANTWVVYGDLMA